jgi:hypothetical protein
VFVVFAAFHLLILTQVARLSPALCTKMCITFIHIYFDLRYQEITLGSGLINFMTINLEISEETAREMLPLLERQLQELSAKASRLASQILEIKQKLSLESNVPLPNFVGPPPFGSSRFGIARGIAEGAPAKTPHGRMRKGYSQRIIADFLKGRNGAGATVKEITAETGTIYSTVLRVLRNLSKDNKVISRKGQWTWAT